MDERVPKVAGGNSATHANLTCLIGNTNSQGYVQIEEAINSKIGDFTDKPPQYPVRVLIKLLRDRALRQL
jgi:hypothetical protein